MTLGNLVRHIPARRARHVPARFFTRDFDRLMDDLWSGFGVAPVAFEPRRFAPVVEAVELDREYRVTAELPGVDAADLEGTVEAGVLTIQARRHFESANDAGEAEAIERFERRIRLPGEIVESEAKATFKNGLLTVSVPKPEEAKPEARSIPVETA
jgi:HSP20 family protein